MTFKELARFPLLTDVLSIHPACSDLEIVDVHIASRALFPATMPAHVVSGVSGVVRGDVMPGSEVSITVRNGSARDREFAAVVWGWRPHGH